MSEASSKARTPLQAARRHVQRREPPPLDLTQALEGDYERLREVLREDSSDFARELLRGLDGLP